MFGFPLLIFGMTQDVFGKYIRRFHSSVRYGTRIASLMDHGLDSGDAYGRLICSYRILHFQVDPDCTAFPVRHFRCNTGIG